VSPSQTIGPFFHFSLTANSALGCVAGPDAKGERIRVRFRLVDGDGVGVPDGMLELWQADGEGKYECGFGRLATDNNGVCLFDTVYPGRLPDGQAPHINVSVFARGLLDRLCTRVYFEGDPGLAQDAVLALVPQDRRATLLARRDAEDRGQWNFDIRLQGEQETVFFDI
jgi:protocatechuate 3,4-dioxygenase, alpha subunit